MPSYNHATFIGHLGRDPELRYTPQGTPVCDFSIAVNNRKKVDGEWKDEPMWIKVHVWGKQAETAAQFLEKGRSVLVDGRLDVEQWKDRDGKDRWNLVLHANQTTFLGDGKSSSGERSSTTSSTKSSSPKTASSESLEPTISDDDIPF